MFFLKVQILISSIFSILFILSIILLSGLLPEVGRLFIYLKFFTQISTVGTPAVCWNNAEFIETMKNEPSSSSFIFNCLPSSYKYFSIFDILISLQHFYISLLTLALRLFLNLHFITNEPYFYYIEVFKRWGYLGIG